MTDAAAGHRYESLDTLRGVAIMMVVAFHVSLHFVPASWLGSIATLGNQGVQLFFLVSAVTMCLMWQLREGEPAQAMRFYVRRFFRIAPLFWAAMAFYLGWEATRRVPLPPDATGWRQIVLTATFLHAFVPDSVTLIVPGGWSIGVEMSFYAVFPLLIRSRMSANQLLVFAFVAYLVLGIVATTWAERSFGGDPKFALFLYYSMLTQFPIFPIGMFIHRVAMRGERIDVWRVALLVAGWLAIALAGKYLFGLNTRPFFWIEVAVFATVAIVVIRRGAQVRALSFLGTVSYSMYLFHVAIVELLMAWVPPERANGTSIYLLCLGLTLAATTALAKLSGLTLEKWSSGLGRRVIVWFDTRGTRQLRAS